MAPPLNVVSENRLSPIVRPPVSVSPASVKSPVVAVMLKIREAVVGVDRDVLRECRRVDRKCLGDCQLSTAECDRLAGKSTVEIDGIRAAASHRAVDAGIGIGSLDRFAERHHAIDNQVVR